MKKYGYLLALGLLASKPIISAQKCAQCVQKSDQTTQTVLLNFANIVTSIILIAASEDPYNSQMLAQQGCNIVQSLSNIAQDAVKSIPAEQRSLMTPEELNRVIYERFCAEGLPEKITAALLEQLEAHSSQEIDGAAVCR